MKGLSYVELREDHPLHFWLFGSKYRGKMTPDDKSADADAKSILTTIVDFKKVDIRNIMVGYKWE